MKKIIILMSLLILAGAGYAWWWNESIKEAVALSTDASQPHDWPELRAKYPRFAITTRLMGMDFLAKATSTDMASKDAMSMMQRLYDSAGIHSLCGIIVSVFAAGSLVGFTVGRRTGKKRTSEQSGGEVRS